MPDIRRLVKPVVRSLRTYEAKEIPCKVKLDANESPYGFTAGLELRFGNSKVGGTSKVRPAIETNRYPDPEAKELRRMVAGSYRVSLRNVLHGNGSDELIYYLITTFGGPVLYPVPTFSMYGIISKALGETTLPVPLNRDFDIDLDKTLSIMKREKPKLIFLSSPNNPTGNCFSAGKILKILDSARGLVVVDEAYQPFSSARGFLPLLKDYQNLVIMRTLSKIGMAALRLGFLVAAAEIIGEVNKVRLPFNVNSFSQAAAIAVLRRGSLLTRSLRRVTEERDRLFLELSAMDGVTPYPSEANFILFRVKSAETAYKALLKKGVLVRTIHPVVPECLRVTVGTEEENDQFLHALRSLTTKNNL